MYKQLTFLEPNIPELEHRVDRIEASTEAVRKGIYARHAELRRMYDDLKWEFDSLKMAICKVEKHG